MENINRSCASLLAGHQYLNSQRAGIALVQGWNQSVEVVYHHNECIVLGKQDQLDSSYTTVGTDTLSFIDRVTMIGIL